jgi:HlyD family secretion protein
MARKNNLRWLVLIAFAAALAVLLGALLAPRPLAVDAAAVHRGPIAETVSDEGVARVRQSYVVSAPIGGRLERLPLEVGDRVAAGQTVVAKLRPLSSEFLDPRTRARAEAVIAAARSALASASAQRDRLAADEARARTDLRRQETLAAKGFTSQQALDNARTAAEVTRNAVRAADADIRSRRAEVTAAEAALTGPEALSAQTVAITSPTSGVITRLLQQSERTVSAGAQLVEIGATTGLEAQIEFLSQDAVKIRPGDKAEIYDWGGAKDIPAEVRLIEPQGFTKISALGVEEQRALVMLEFTGPPSSWAGLAPGYRVWARVYLRRTPSALLAPAGALVREAGGWAVFRIEGGRARLRRVQVGVITDKDAEILKGLSAGDKLVVYPSDKVRDGVRVTPRG